MTTRTRWAVLGGALAAALLAAAPAMAQNQNQNQNQNGQGTTRSAPEFDPAVAGIIGAIVAGGAVILARTRRRS